ncbi:MAG TPA: hypothetical protein VGI78_03810 [Acetobacteraceae bacterium]|jgi:hypothetical protein
MRIAALTLAASMLAAPAFAQNKPVTGVGNDIPAPMVRAIQAMVSPATLRELKSRATGGNTMENVLETTLLQNLQLIDPGTQGARIIAIDFTRQVVVAAVGDQPPKVYHFDRKTLTVTK